MRRRRVRRGPDRRSRRPPPARTEGPAGCGVSRPFCLLVYRCDRLTAVLSRKSKYGLKALLVLAEQAGTGPVLVSELSERDRIPKKFLEAILLELKRHGVVHSKKGKGGGYFLHRQPAD